ncbi:MAG TPA: GntR family transcriptional regulator, partial [Actinotalea sp.]|nr:GntR family transcriptional regulator [Actinotalea sp.]
MALSASLQPFAGLADHRLCEYPAEPKQVATDLSVQHLELDADGQVAAPDAPGLGVDVDLEALAPYLRTVEITVDADVVFRSPDVSSPPRVRRRERAVAEPPSGADRASGYAMRGLQGRVIDGVGRAIVGGRFAPGELVPKESELTAEYEVSRTSVREAMRVLAAKGLVDIRQKV